MTNPRPRWPHQEYANTETWRLIDSGTQSLCVTSPTGGGKSRMMEDAIVEARRRRWPVTLYTDRILLLDQISGFLKSIGIDHGYRASGREESHWKDVQLCMIQTESSRVLKREIREHHRSGLVIVDEAHKMKGSQAEELFGLHRADGARLCGFTATPVAISHIYEKLVVAGKNSDLRACGAHVPCITYAPDQPTTDLKPQKTGEFKDGDVIKAIMTPVIFGRVYSHWQALNPDARPTILFAPGVKESVWFADQFRQKGIRSAHIDGEDGVWVDGEVVGKSQEVRQQVLEDVKSGRIQIICNRFVLREGLDLPVLYHGILATMFGSITSYLQSVGRLLRSHPSLTEVILQDHGGNYWRHGDPNADREWDMTKTALDYHRERIEQMRQDTVREPIACVECGLVREYGPECPSCGHRQEKWMRRVIEKDGHLSMRFGKMFRPIKVEKREDTEQLWRSMYHRMRNAKSGKKTFKNAYDFFRFENRYAPPKDLPFMPIDPVDWDRRIQDVPRDRLIQKKQEEVW